MISNLRGRVSSAHVIALLALFVALGGTAFAAATIGTHDIKGGAVTAKKLHKKAVRAKKIKNRAVTSPKIAAGAVLGGNLAAGSVTASKLADTEDGVATQTVPPNNTRRITVKCPSGDQAITGGYSTPPGGAVQVTRMRRFSDAAWAFTFRNTSNAPHAVDASVTCLHG
jgi:hypothetical protein